jgi:transcriptional regulator with XRE-family HTH domain
LKCKKVTKQEHSLTINGKKVQLARIERGWTISKLSNESGVTRKTISEIERGNKKKIRFSTIHQLAVTLEKEVDLFCI